MPDPQRQPMAKFDPGKTFVVKGATLNKLLDAAIPIRAGRGLKATHTTQGTIFSVENEGEIPPFSPMIRSNGVTDDVIQWQAALTPGIVTARQISGAQALGYFPPLDLVDGDDLVWHDITPGQAVYVKCACKKTGKLDDTAPPIVAVDAADLAGAHYRPEIFAYTGADGEHNYLMFVCGLESGKPVITPFHSGSNIDHEPTRGTWKNRTETGGDVRPIGDTFDPTTDTGWLKCFRQLQGTGILPIVKPLGGGETAETKTSIDLYGLRQRATGAQLQLVVVGDAIEFRGNGVDGENEAVAVTDGFVTEVKTDSGWWGNMTLIVNDGGSGSQSLVWRVENGRIQSVDVNGTGIPGTSGDPGDAELEIDI